jgi:hypothetical protein
LPDRSSEHATRHGRLVAALQRRSRSSDARCRARTATVSTRSPGSLRRRQRGAGLYRGPAARSRCTTAISSAAGRERRGSARHPGRQWRLRLLPRARRLPVRIGDVVSGEECRQRQQRLRLLRQPRCGRRKRRRRHRKRLDRQRRPPSTAPRSRRRRSGRHGRLRSGGSPGTAERRSILGGASTLDQLPLSARKLVMPTPVRESTPIHVT